MILLFFSVLLFFKRIKDIRQWKINFWLCKLPHQIFLFTVYQQNKRTYSHIQILRTTIELRFYKNWNTGTGTKCGEHLDTFSVICDDIPYDVLPHSPEYNVPQIPHYVPRILCPVPVFRVLDRNKATVFLKSQISSFPQKYW